MAIMKKDKDMKRVDIDFQYASNVVAVKWFDNDGVTMVCTCLEECNIKSYTRVKGQHQNTCPMSRYYQRLQLWYGWW